jgi:hypothetical protein
MVNENVIIQNHEIRFATVDLGASAKEIREQLLMVIGVSNSNIQHEPAPLLHTLSISP